uniref:polymorphic toxin type 25 domain-containing protein n=1 Tax=Leclercia adecarboxylata TaxID=83655 RepID=UPI0025513138
SSLATIAAGIAGGLAGDGTAAAVAGAQSGKTTVENNSLSPPTGMMNYGQAVTSWNQYAVDNNLTQEQTQEGLNRIATGEGASWGTEYKVKPYVKGEVAGGAGADYYFDTSIDPYQISANHGETLAVGGRISGQIGVQFGPYFPGTIGSERNSSIGLGLGVISSEVSYGKDGFGFSLGVGPAWGWSGISTNVAGEKVDINGSSGTEFYHHDFGKDKAK